MAGSKAAATSTAYLAPPRHPLQVLEVIAELGAPALPLVDLMSALPQEATPQEREALRERELELLADLAAARERVRVWWRVLPGRW